MPPRNSSARVTLRDIAKAAGVHFTTVGMALRGSPEISAATRERISALAKKLGYRPDPMLSALNAYRNAKSRPRYQATIAWINNWPEQEELLRNPSFREYYEGAKARAEELGYLVEEFWLRGEGMHPSRLQDILRARNIEAVLLAPQPESHMFISMDYSQFAVIAFGYSLQPSVFHVVTNHHFHTMNLLLQHLQDLDYRRVGLFVTSDWNEKVENSLLGGLALARWKSKKLKNVPPLLETRTTDAMFLSWLETHKPDVVVSHSGTIKSLQKLGYRVPKDIGFASLNLGPGESISGVYQNNIQIGRAAVDYLVAMLHSGERGVPAIPMRTLVESEWRQGNSLRA
ncbi:LacI family DNA-binding transcriptional regulator [soil metagenome]